MASTANQPHKVELATFLNGRFLGWQDAGIFPSARAAWDFLKSRGETAEGKDDRWMAYPASYEPVSPLPHILDGPSLGCGEWA